MTTAKSEIIKKDAFSLRCLIGCTGKHETLHLISDSHYIDITVSSHRYHFKINIPWSAAHDHDLFKLSD